MTARILVCDDISQVGLEQLFRSGFEVHRRPGIRPEELLRRVPSYDALLVRSRTPVGPELIEAAPRLRLIGRAGYGPGRIDLPAATQAGVVVLHSPEGNAVTAAEYAIAMVFNLARHIPAADASLRAGRWDKRRYRGIELRGKRLGVIGMGRVGRNVVERAAGLQMTVLVHDPLVSPSEIEAAGGVPAEWDELLATSDFLTVHVSASAATRGLINEEAFHRMKDRVRIVNCSVRGVVEEKALLHALRTGKVAGAAIDVFDEEPPLDNPLLEMPQVIATPHLLASTFEAQIEVARSLASQVADFFERGVVHEAVNPAVLTQLRAASSAG
ncbi:MAG: hypothetical protein KDA24_06855 [Deltaproteobacteria bacterium]|nr:hypothetical protein [Deltaproteobacteria bacterium]